MRHTWVESKTAARATDNTDQNWTTEEHGSTRTKLDHGRTRINTDQNWTTEEHGSNSTTETRINTDQTQPRKNTDQHGSVSSS